MKYKISKGGVLAFLLFFIYTLYYFLYVSNPGQSDLRVMGLFCFAQLCLTYYKWARIHKVAFDAYSVFLVAAYAFCTGQIILNFFGVIIAKRSLITDHDYPTSLLFTVLYLTMSFLYAFDIGVNICDSSRKEKKHTINYDAESSYGIIRKVSSVVAFLTFPFFIYLLIINFIAVRTEGYLGLYNTDSSRIAEVLSELFIPAILCMFVISELTGKNIKRNRILLILFVFIPPFILGGRSEAVIIAAIALIVYSLVHKINLKSLILLSLAAYAMLVIFHGISESRADNDKTAIEALAEEEDGNNPAVATIAEMGWSMYPAIETYRIVPQRYPFRYGKSYLFAFTTIIPNLGFWTYHPAKKESTLGEWLQDFNGLTFGPGYSFVAEAYANFGWAGFFFMIILGYAYALFFSNINKYTLLKDPILFIISLIMLWFLIKTVRNSFINVVRAFFYYSLPFYLLFHYYVKKINHNKK